MGRSEILLGKHRATDISFRSRHNVAFVSGWQTENPFVDEYFPIEKFHVAAAQMSHYEFLSDDALLSDKIRRFHKRTDGIEYEDGEVFAASGASQLILAFLLTMKGNGITRIYYNPPIYYNFYYFADLLDIELTPLSHVPLVCDDIQLKLPGNQSCLVISDPIWMMGIPLRERHLDQIRRWQEETSSIVFVDGTFQYLGWGTGREAEQSAFLCRERTLRLVCPTKSTLIHGVRFAYLILPKLMREDIRYASANMSGASGSLNVAASHVVMDTLNSDRSNLALRELISRRFDMLDNVLFKDAVGYPRASYYVFAKPLIELDRLLGMDQEFFDVEGYPSYLRFNLLLAAGTLCQLGVT